MQVATACHATAAASQFNANTHTPVLAAILAQEAALPSPPAIDSSMDVRARVRQALLAGDVKTGVHRRAVLMQLRLRDVSVACSDIFGEFF